MKGALLVLALLVTRELTFETHEVRKEACPVFYEMQIIVNFVLPRAALNENFDSVSATDEEKAAFGKIQDCFIEVGHQNRVNHLIFKILVIFSKDCTGYRVSTLVNTIKGFFSILPSLHMRIKRTYHAAPETAEWTAKRDLTDPRDTKIILKKKKEKKIPDKPLQDEAA
ncbi:major allergen I polypeptide chain 2-like [Budorcas taxicolor]|uniref:major allergen I polypeptide chain 2-like n=1 Tax=Budorcas taxicolor TaxID=37181 RepID=UPI0022836E74|nr:major allergen I polypeptide chain 2-like [Budorcas taxicolor]